MTRGRTRRSPAGAVLVALVVALLVSLLAGCVSVPTAGRVDKVEGQQQSCQNCVDVEVAPPSPGDGPDQIVLGFLRANANYQARYEVARQYLTRAADQAWKPEDGVTVYSGSTTVAGEAVRLTGRVVGKVSSDRSYTAQETRLDQRFTLVRQDGEWRIDNPPAGLLVADWAFSTNYSSYDLFFIANGRPSDRPSAVQGPVLVPDPIYLPRLRTPDQVASALVKALVVGPTSWLAPAVSTAIPPGTTLSVDSVTISNGIASVALSDTILALPDAQRSLLAAQIVYTPKEALAIRGVSITVNQQGFRVPESDPTTLVVLASAISAQVDPVSPTGGDQLYVVHDGSVQLVDASSGALRPFAGDLGSVRVGSLAVSVTDAELAAVSTDRTRLVQVTSAGQDTRTRTVLSGVTDLVRPQFTRFGELWALGRSNGQQRLWRAVDKAEVVDAPQLRGRDLTAFSFSPDGVRVAFLERTASGQRLLLARVDRGDGVDISKVVVLDTTQPGRQSLTQLKDLAWLDATHVIVLGSATAKETAGPYSVSQDASTIVDQGEALAWNPSQVAVLLRTQSAIVLSKDGQTWRDQGTTWVPFVTGVQAVAYPG